MAGRGRLELLDSGGRLDSDGPIESPREAT
jgi:hypothetical protein